MADSKPLAGRLQISVLELADCSISGIFDIRATVTGETVLGKHWSHGYRSAHQPDSAVQVSHPIKNDEKRAFTPINAVMLLPLIGPVSHQFVVLDLRKGKTRKSDSKHKSLGFARLLLYPLMEGAADGHAKEQTIWLELRSLKALAHLTRTRFSSKSEDEPGTRTSTQSENAAVDESHDALHEPQGTVVGRLKVTVKLEVDRGANAAACYRPEQPIVVAYPPFSASRLLHAIAEVADHFINPISELIYEFMGMLNWERPLHTFIYLYFWLTFMVYIEWGMVLLHLLVIYFFFSGPLNRDFGLVELINLMLHPDDNAPQRDTDFTSTHYDVDLFHPRDIALRNLPRHHHLGPYPAVKHVSKRSEAREQGVRVGDMLTQVNGTGVGGESLETIHHFLLDLEQESLANGGSEPVTMTFKRRAAGIHAATARRLAADATNALANVAAKSGGAIISGGKGVVKGVKKVLSSHSRVDADVVDVLEEEADKYQDHLLNYEDETAAILGKRVDSIATSFIAGNCRPEQLIFYDSVTGTMTMAVNGDDYDAAWVDPDVNNPTSLGLTMQAAIANAEGAAWFGKAVTKLFLWGNPVETRNTILGLAISCVVHCFLPNRYIYAGVVALLFVKHTKMFGAARFMLAARSAVALEEDVLIHGANRKSKSIGSFSMNELDQTFLLEYQQLRGGSWVEMDSTQIKPWCQPSNPRLLCRKNDVHHPHGRVWNGDWIVGRLVLTGEHPPVYNAEEVIGTSRGLRAGWEYAESLQELSSIPLGNNPSEPQLSSRMRYRLWFRRTQAKSD